MADRPANEISTLLNSYHSNTLSEMALAASLKVMQGNKKLSKGDLIAKMSHRQDAPRYGWAQWTTSVSNKAEARRMLQRWAKALRTRLDEASGKAPSDG